MIKVIYDRKTRKVIVTEKDGEYTLPKEYEIACVDEKDEAFSDVCGEIYLRERTMN